MNKTKLHICIDCNKKISKGAKRCKSCAKKGLLRKIKLHLCCGDIYLYPNYINCDIKGTLIGDCFGNPNLTTLGKYYKYPFGTKPREFILDRKFDILKLWPFPGRCFDEILMVSAIEHFTLKEAEHIIKEAYANLKPGGILKIDFPHILNIIAGFTLGNDSWSSVMRHIYCNGKNEHSIHKWGYNRVAFKKLLRKDKRLWKITFKEIIEHSYPMIGCEAIKL